jgi:CRISPR-associated protein Csb2
MTLVLEIEHLLGVAFAAQSPASTEPDWPPQPDRVFSALVAAWAKRGEQIEERRALEWLEAQPAPEISASSGFARTAATVFVPPNDPQTGRIGDRSVLPPFRQRQPRRFPAFRPDDPTVRLLWRDVQIAEETIAALNALAADTAYIGHSSSLTRCRFWTGDPSERCMQSRRQVYAGRLTELERNYSGGRRPSPGKDVSTPQPTNADVARSVFSDRWLVLEHVRGEMRNFSEEMPDLRAAALVAKALRCAIMAGYRKNGLETALPAVVSGHAADGSPLIEPHLAIAPLAFIGSQYATERVFGMALIPPGDGGLLDDPDFQRAIRSIAPWIQQAGRRELKLTCDGFNLRFTFSSETAARSLDPEPYVTVAKTWATCTPIVLDRHLKATKNTERDREVRELIAQACRNTGLPPPAYAAARSGHAERGEIIIAANKHSAIQHVPSAYPSGRMPRWTGWRLPKTLASRQLSHAVIEFPEPVRGPVILGAGRFVGLGLCRALDVKAG